MEDNERVEKSKNYNTSPPRGGSPRKNPPATFEQRLRAVKLHLEEGFTQQSIAQEMGFSSSAVYKWAQAYQLQGEEALKSRLPGPREPRKLPEPVRQKILELKKEEPTRGIKRISHLLRRVFFLKASAETVRRTLKEQGLVESPPKPKRNLVRPRFFERATPNQMWQTDIFTFRLGGRYAYLIGFMDDYSRFMVGADLFRSHTAENVLEVFRVAAAEYQPPKEMLTDNGREYVNWRGTTRFQAEMKKNGTHHFKSRPHHPMTLGKIERFWETIWQEFLSRAQFESFDSARERIRFWIKYYNHKRPHQGIEGLCPADRYFEIATQLRQTIEAGIKENLLEMALRGEPKAPFYMVGRMEGQSVVLRAEKGKLKLELSDANHQPLQELTYELNQSKANQPGSAAQGAAPQGPPLQPLQLQRAGESSGGAGGLDRTVHAGGHLPANEHQLRDVLALAAAGHASDAPGSGDSDPSGPQRPQPQAPDAAAEIPGATLSSQSLTLAAKQCAKQDCQPAGRSGKSTALDEALPPVIQSPAAPGIDPPGPFRPDLGHHSGPDAGHLPPGLPSVGETGAQSDAPGAGGSATGPAQPDNRSAEGSSPGSGAGTGAPGSAL
jgi:transposase InsO family protein